MKKRLGIILISIVALTSCTLEIPLEDSIADPIAISSPTSARRALSTAYLDFKICDYILPFTTMSDECVPTTILPKNLNMYGTYNWREEQLIQLSENIWTDYYKTIVYVNTLQDRLGNVKITNDKDKMQMESVICEAEVLKAFCYLNLIRTFTPAYSKSTANKPGIVIKNRAKLEENKDRATLQTSIDTTRNMLKRALKNKSWSVKSKRWLSKDAAICIAAELEIWCGNYQAVIDISKPLLDRILAENTSQQDYQNIWEQRSSKSTIFNIDREGTDMPNMFQYWNDTDGDYMVVNENIVYEKGDIRAPYSVDSATFAVNYGESFKPVLNLGKYNKMSKDRTTLKYVNIFRNADVKLLAAEAYARLDKLVESVKVLNNFLKSRNATEVQSTISKDNLIEKILLERKKEFVGEGKIYFDIKRTSKKALTRNRAFEVPLTEIKKDDYRRTLPIPASEFKYNKKATQNSGWEHIVSFQE